MALQVVGAGVGRTGTTSLKLALERVLGGPCYHMVEVFGHPEQVPIWAAAMRDEPVDWSSLMSGYVATVDWPGAAVWRDILAANPGAKVLLSTRASTEEWWRSASNTIFEGIAEVNEGMEEWRAMGLLMVERLAAGWPDEAATCAGYERHNAAVRAEVPPDQLIDWQPSDGWAPLCEALGVAVPDEPFPVANTMNEFRTRQGKDPIPLV